MVFKRTEGRLVPIDTEGRGRELERKVAVLVQSALLGWFGGGGGVGLAKALW